MKSILPFSITLFFLVACNPKSKTNVVKPVDQIWLDSIIKNSDSSYIRPYKRTDFVMAEFYVSKKDASICQLMKDSAGKIRQIVIAKNNVRVLFVPYYANGSIQADLPVDEFGQFHGKGSFYYENGEVQSSGNYVHGFKTGEWKSYTESGELINTDTYNEKGQLINPQHQ